MKLAVCTQTPEVSIPLPLALLGGSFEQRLEKARQLGLAGIELLAARPLELDARQIKKQIKQAGLGVAAIASGPVFMQDRLSLLSESTENSRLAEDRLVELMELAVNLETPLVTVGSFRGRIAWAAPEGVRKLADMLSKAAVKAQRLGVRIALEPLNRYENDFLHNAGETLDFIASVGEANLGILLDTFHMNIEEADIRASVRQAVQSGRLWHVHLGDSNRLAPGLGHFDFAALVDSLALNGYEGYLSAELLPRPDADQAASLTVDYMHRLGV
jgi:5-keto-L-gluconate epimerase